MHLVYIDQNVLSHSDNPIFTEILLSAANAFGAQLAISEIHLIEISRSQTPELFIKRIDALKPILIQSCSENRQDGFTRTLVDNFNTAEVIKNFKSEKFGMQSALLHAHLPILKNIGGLVDITPETLLEIYLKNMFESVNELKYQMTSEEIIEFDLYFEPILANAKRDITTSFQNIDFEGNQNTSNELRWCIRNDGGLHQRSAAEVVPSIIALAQNIDQKIFADFPRNFTELGGDIQTKISSLAFILYLLGAVPRSGKLLRGTSDQQAKLLFAQVLDTYHIAAAAGTHCFLTFDKDASRLAEVVYKHAGISTWVASLPHV